MSIISVVVFIVYMTIVCIICFSAVMYDVKSEQEETQITTEQQANDLWEALEQAKEALETCDTEVDTFGLPVSQKFDNNSVDYALYMINSVLKKERNHDRD